MPSLRPDEAGDSDFIFTQERESRQRYCHERFRSLMLQRKERYRKNPLCVRNEIIEEIIDFAAKDGIKFFELKPGMELAEELTRPQIIQKVRRMYTYMFQVDQRKQQDAAAPTGRPSDRNACHNKEHSALRNVANPSKNQNSHPESVVDHRRIELHNKRPRISELAEANASLPTLKTNDDTEPVTVLTTTLPTTFESCLLYLNESLTKIERKQMAGIAAARKHLQQCLEEHAEVATAKAKLAHLSLHPERFNRVYASDMLDTITQSISEGGAIQITSVAGNTYMQCGQTVSPPIFQQNGGLPTHEDSLIAYPRESSVGNAAPDHPIHNRSPVAVATEPHNTQRLSQPSKAHVLDHNGPSNRHPNSVTMGPQRATTRIFPISSPTDLPPPKKHRKDESDRPSAPMLAPKPGHQPGAIQDGRAKYPDWHDTDFLPAMSKAEVVRAPDAAAAAVTTRGDAHGLANSIDSEESHEKEDKIQNHPVSAMQDINTPCETPSSSLANTLLAEAIRSALG